MRIYVIAVMFMVGTHCVAQQVPEQEAAIETQQELVETIGSAEIPLPDDVGDWMVDLNATDAAEILQSPLFTSDQAQAILRHRTMFGRFLQTEELQVLNEFDTAVIRRIKPHLLCGKPILDERFRPSEVLALAKHECTFRLRRNPNDKAGFNSDGQFPFFTGDPNQVYLRYRLQAGNYLSAGLVMEKDAGERMFARANGGRMDFFSWHVFLRPNTRIRQLAIGDYQVQFGQGLVAWNGISLGKSTEVHQVYRRGVGLRPYSSAGEFGYYRGLAIAAGGKRNTVHGWLSYRKLDASLFPVDTTFTIFQVSSILSSGLHRTWDEIGKKAVLGQWVAGAHWQREHQRWRHELTSQYTGYEYPLWPGDDPYEVYDPSGKHFFVFGYAGRYMLPNGSFYMEAAMDKEGHPGLLAGLVLLPDRTFTISLQGRYYARNFHSPAADALREGSSVRNEQGLFTGFTWQLHQQCRLQGYLDIFRFPWLRYTTAGPVNGKEWLLQFTWVPSRTTELYVRFRQEEKPADAAEEKFKIPGEGLRRNLRFHTQWIAGRHLEWSLRCEWVQQQQQMMTGSGILFYQEARYKPMGKPYSIAARWSVFKTTGYESRIYSYEQDMAGAFSLPAYSGEGSRWYLLIRYRLMKGVDGWVRYAVTMYRKSDAGLSEIVPPSREVKVQIRWQF